MRRICVFLGLILALLSRPAAAEEPPYHTGMDATFAPHAMARLGGGYEGFNVDLAEALGKQLGRKIDVEYLSFSALIPNLQSGRYDFLIAPTTVTRERADNMLFTEGYLWTEYQFGIRKGGKPITSLDDLRGRKIAVNKGSAYDAWAHENAEKYGFEVLTFDTNPDAVQAVVSGQADANLAGNTVVRYAATRNPLFVPDYELKQTRAAWAMPFRKDEVELRGVFDNALKCLKLNGTIVKLSEKWFHTTPAPDDLERVVDPGWGVPGMPGYDPGPHPPKC